MPAYHKCLNCGSPELVGGVVKAGWRVHRHDLEDCGLQWPYVPPHFPLPTDLFFKEIEICQYAWDSEWKSQDCFHRGAYGVFKLPELW